MVGRRHRSSGPTGGLSLPWRDRAREWDCSRPMHTPCLPGSARPGAVCCEVIIYQGSPAVRPHCPYQAEASLSARPSHTDRVKTARRHGLQPPAHQYGLAHGVARRTQSHAPWAQSFFLTATDAPAFQTGTVKNSSMPQALHLRVEQSGPCERHVAAQAFDARRSQWRRCAPPELPPSC